MVSCGDAKGTTSMHRSLKTLTIAACGFMFCGSVLSGPADAQGQAPIGHRQPSATDVPANDSVRGDPALAGVAAPATPKRKKGSRARTRRVQNNVDVIMKTPNICSNCNQ
jgi:hypothetical protein